LTGQQIDYRQFNFVLFIFALYALIISRIITCRHANVRRGDISVRQHDAKLMSVPECGVDRPF